MTAIVRLPDIYRALQQLGLKKGQLRALLPDWWDDEVATSEIGMWEFILLVARRLSIDAYALSQGAIQPVGPVSQAAYKHRRNVGAEQYQATSMVAASLAESIIAAMPQGFVPPSGDVADVRREVCQANGGIVDFDGLMSYCWLHGIPVIPLPNLPIGLRKMDGAIFMVRDRPAIIISRKNDSRAWLSFILAHELGHLCQGHLASDSSIIDIDLKADAMLQAEQSSDGQEREADQFALDLLGGPEADSVINGWSTHAPGVELAVKSRAQSQAIGVAAGHLVLRHAFKTHRWPEAQVALNFLSEDFEAQEFLKSALGQNIRLEAIAEDLQELVVSITGVAHA